MRTIPFREVLHGVAYRMGLDPDQSNFLSNQAIPIGTYIDQWVRRTYDMKDWPEWVVTHKFAPSSHVVSWDAVAIDLVIPPSVVGTLVQLGTILQVFLVDPATTDAPVDTPFTLMDRGIHAGYEHGSYVWIRFMTPPPRYTAVTWRSDQVYSRDDVTYSYTTGQVYKSKSNGNLGNDPSNTFAPPPVPHVIEPLPPSPKPVIETTQQYIPSFPAASSQSQITRVTMTEDSTVPGSTYTMTVTSSDSLEHSVDYVSESDDSASDILTGLVAAAAASTDTFWADVTSTLDSVAATLDIDIGQSFSVDAEATLVGSPWWELVPFPKAIADQVITGALGDLLAEWGQTDKSAAVQQGVAAEMQIADTKFETTPNPALSGQQRALGRYQL